MKKNKYFIIFALQIIFIFVIIIVYTKFITNNNSKYIFQSMREKFPNYYYNSLYNITEYKKDYTGLISPTGIIKYKNNLVICDKENNCINVFDEYMNFIAKIGVTGNGPLEFIAPTGIFENNSEIYVIDSGNNRIQIIDSSFNYVDSIQLPILNTVSHEPFIDIVVDKDGGIYLSSHTYQIKENAKIYYLKPNSNSFIKTKLSIYGYLSIYQNEIYSINTYEFYEEENSVGVQTGQSYMYSVKKNKIKKVFKFPHAYSPTDFFIYDNTMYCFSHMYKRIDKFSLEGEYIETIALLPDIEFGEYMTLFDDNIFFITDTKNGSVYKIKYE